MTKILLIAGHGAGDPGAAGNGTTEAVETRRVVNALIAPLRANGFSVSSYDQNKNAFVEAQAGRLDFGGTFDYVFEVHFNAFNTTAKGTEAYVTTAEVSTTVEQFIVESLGKYFVNRGVKRTNFAVIQQAKNRGMKSCLYEMCFIDNAEDMQVYNNNFNSIIQDMANAIARGFGLNINIGNENNNQNTTKKENDIMYIYEVVRSGENVEIWFMNGLSRWHLPTNEAVSTAEAQLKTYGYSTARMRFRWDNLQLRRMEAAAKEIK